MRARHLYDFMRRLDPPSSEGAGGDMAERLSIESDEAIVEVLPRLGGWLAAFDLKIGAERLPILRRWTGRVRKSAQRSRPARWSRGSTASRAADSPSAERSTRSRRTTRGAGAAAWRRLALALGGGRAVARPLVLRLRSRAIPPFDYEATQIDRAGRRDARDDAFGQASRPGSDPLRARPASLVRAHAGDAACTPRVGHVAGAAAGFPGEHRRRTPIPDEWDFNTPASAARRFLRQRLCRLGRPRPHRMAGPRRRRRYRGRSGTRFYHVYSLDSRLPRSSASSR